MTAFIEPHVAKTLRTGASWESGGGFQFERLGYFFADKDSAPPPGALVLNRTVTLKDAWAKAAAKS